MKIQLVVEFIELKRCYDLTQVIIILYNVKPLYTYFQQYRIETPPRHMIHLISATYQKGTGNQRRTGRCKTLVLLRHIF